MTQMKQTIEYQKMRIELLEQENYKWNGEDLEEVVGMRSRLQDTAQKKNLQVHIQHQKFKVPMTSAHVNHSNQSPS